MPKLRSFVASLAMLAAVVPASGAMAEVLVGATRTTAAVYGGATYTVAFDGGSAFNFTTSGPSTRVVFMFNAECAVDGAPGQWVDIDILVNPAGAAPEAAVPPTNGDNAFCSGNGTDSPGFTLDGWVSAAAIGVTTLPAGTHSVRVRVNGGSAGVTRLDDMSLVVMR